MQSQAICSYPCTHWSMLQTLTMESASLTHWLIWQLQCCSDIDRQMQLACHRQNCRITQQTNTERPVGDSCSLTHTDTDMLVHHAHPIHPWSNHRCCGLKFKLLGKYKHLHMNMHAHPLWLTCTSHAYTHAFNCGWHAQPTMQFIYVACVSS